MTQAVLSEILRVFGESIATFGMMKSPNPPILFYKFWQGISLYCRVIPGKYFLCIILQDQKRNPRVMT